MEIGLRSAFVISAVIHACIAAPFYSHNLLKIDFEKKNAVIVDYVILNQISNFAPANIGNKESVAVAEAPKADAKNARVNTENKAVAKHAKPDYRKKAEVMKSKEKIKETVSKADKKEAEIKSSKDYIDYYGLLKNRIRARLKENYKFYKGEGDVYLSFVLNAKGALLANSIDRSRSSKDEVLLQITQASLKAIAPFPPLPKAIAAKEISFNITISFKKQ